MSSGVKYFLYIPVWATTQQPPGSSGGGSSGGGGGGSEGSEGSGGGESETGGGGSGASSGLSGSGGGSGGSGGGGGSGGSGGGGSGGSGGGSGSGSGSGSSMSSSGNCLLFGTLVTRADGSRMPIELLAPGDMVLSAVLPGLELDVEFKAQYEWLSTWGLDGASVRPARVAEVKLGEHDGFYLINRRIKATFEHPFLVRRDDAWGFCSAEQLSVGDCLITQVNDEFGEEVIESIERISARVRTVAIRVPGTNTYLADGVWTHNDASGSGSSGAKSSGSSFSSSSSGSGSSGSGEPSIIG